MFASKSPTPLPAPLPGGAGHASNSSNSHSRSNGDTSLDDGWDNSTTSATSATSSSTVSGWDAPEPSSKATTVAEDGWGDPIAKQDTTAGGDSWRPAAAREASSDIDLE